MSLKAEGTVLSYTAVILAIIFDTATSDNQATSAEEADSKNEDPVFVPKKASFLRPKELAINTDSEKTNKKVSERTKGLNKQITKEDEDSR